VELVTAILGLFYGKYTARWSGASQESTIQIFQVIDNLNCLPTADNLAG
jgi:hypothetical protein